MVTSLQFPGALADPGMGGPGALPPLAKSRGWVTGKATTDCISPYDKAIASYLKYKKTASENGEICVLDNHTLV